VEVGWLVVSGCWFVGWLVSEWLVEWTWLGGWLMGELRLMMILCGVGGDGWCCGSPAAAGSERLLSSCCLVWGFGCLVCGVS